MYKGIVMKFTKKYAVVLEQNGQYFKIKFKNGLAVGQKIYFFEEDLLHVGNGEKTELSWMNNDFWKKAVSFSVMAACILFFFFFGNILGLPMGNNTSYAVVSLDINPSVEMTINQERSVTKVVQLNEEGYKVAGQYLIGLKVEDAVKSVIENAAKQDYLAEQDTILLAASLAEKEDINGDKAQEIINEISASELPGMYSYLFVTSKPNDYEKAKQNEISLGKYEMTVMSKGKIEPDKIKNMKVKEILETQEIKSKITEKNQKTNVLYKESNERKQNNNGNLQKSKQSNQKSLEQNKSRNENPAKDKGQTGSAKENEKELKEQKFEPVRKRFPDPPQGIKPGQFMNELNYNHSQDHQQPPEADGQEHKVKSVIIIQ
ncbi:MAG: Anti-sigma-I factor RsgI4 [Candidatus Dichloromethanomonas elyunquensis]|nr:MAG: Anti-sigma-I factor RsgI4 [Candidatus Dichloromethanomonas elyunquensis]